MKNLTVPVVFEVELDPRREGVIPRLLGSISELGFFDTACGVDAKMIAQDSRIWRVKVEIPQRSFFFYNWVLMKEEEVLEEEEHYREADVEVFGGIMKTKYGEGTGEFVLDGGCKVFVVTHYQPSVNESLEVVGTGDYLGNWSTDGPSRWFVHGDVWGKKFEMPQGTTEDFKLVILDRESGRIKKWQSGENRMIKIEEGLNFKIVFVPWGGRYIQEGMVIPVIRILECFDYRPADEELSPVASPVDLPTTSSKLSLTNGDLDEISPDLKLTLAQYPTFRNVMALLCNDGQDEDCFRDQVADGDASESNASTVVKILDEIETREYILKTAAEPIPCTSHLLSGDLSQEDVNDAALRQLPFFPEDVFTDKTSDGGQDSTSLETGASLATSSPKEELVEEANSGEQKSTSLETDALSEASSPNEVIDASLLQLPILNAGDTTDVGEEQIVFETAESSEAYIDAILNNVMQLPVCSEDASLESTTHEEKKASTLEAPSPKEATNDNLMQLQLLSAHELSEIAEEKTTSVETALSSATYSPRDAINAILKPFEVALSSGASSPREVMDAACSLIESHRLESPRATPEESLEVVFKEDVPAETLFEFAASVEEAPLEALEANMISSQESNSEEKWSKPRKTAFKMFNFVNSFCYRMVF